MMKLREKVQVSPGKDLSGRCGGIGGQQEIGGCGGIRGCGRSRRRAVTTLPSAFSGNLTLFQRLHFERELDFARKIN